MAARDEEAAGAKALAAPFRWRGAPGLVQVDCAPNRDPERWGCWSGVADGFPVCTATVEFPALGYRSMFGWVQLVRSTENASGGLRFEIDPFSLFNDTPTPYCWYGTAPTLFDAPSRARHQRLEWVAHSFLATTPLEEVARWRPRRVVPLVGFSWGFTDTGSRVVLHEPEVLSGEAWDAHLELLRSVYQWWHFAASGEMDPDAPQVH